MICLSLLLLLPAFHDGDSWSDQAAQLLDQGNIGAAVEILQRHTGEVPDDALGWRLLARAYLGVADEWAASGGDVDLPLTDAKNAAQRAIELQPFDTLVLATQFDVATRLADHRTAAAVALQALGEAVLRDGAVPPEWIARAARARIARFRAAPPADQDAYAAAFAELYRLSESAVAQAASDVELRVLVADFLVTEGLPAVAEADIADALRGDPENAALHQKLIDIDFHQGVAERLAPIYERLAEAVPAGPVFVWYRGYAQLLKGDTAQRERRLFDALESYRECERLMQESAAMESAYADGSRRIAMLASLGRGVCALDDGDLDGATTILLAQLDRNADLRHEPDGLQTTLVDALGRLGSALEQQGDFAAGAAVAQRVAEVEETDAQWWNNLGYFLRERATQVNQTESAGELTADAARTIFRRSWQAYCKAAELAPDDPRIVNDAALIQVYHLREELPLAERMLGQAIDAGERALRELGDHADPSERFPIAQAVGDAYENLGYLAYHVKHDDAAARELFTRAVATSSGPRSSSTYLEALDGKRAPIVERARTAGSGGEPPPAARGLVKWEWSLADALCRAQHEHRVVLVYYRGAGLGLSVPLFDRLVMSEAFAHSARAAVCVVADRARHTLIDRLGNGRLLACPHFGAIPCSAHVALDDEFLKWWQEARGDDDAETPAEGFYFLAPDGKRLVPGGQRLPAMLEAAASEVGEPVAGADLDQLAEQLVQGQLAERRRAAATMWASFAAGRARVEALLFDRLTATQARQALIDAVAAAGDADGLLLLEALVQQGEDERIALLALERWPAVASAEVLRRVLDWSPFAAVRAFAARVLAANAPDELTQRVLAAHEAAGR